MVAGAVVAVLVGCAVGWLMGGYDRAQSMRAAGLTAFFMAGLVVLDRFMIEWPNYVANSRIRGRPIATIGSATPNLEGNWWIQNIDTFTHLLLPTVALLLVSLASYSRYSRASMLEIMQQDYIRTARAKGLPERTVVMRHAFRNALIPLATLVAFDIGALLGGAVITEKVFSFTGMGALFVDSLIPIPDPNPVMGVFLITGIVAMVFNLVADLAYSVLDPRVRVKA
jgi:peptide/nickel transport system permease protein